MNQLSPTTVPSHVIVPESMLTVWPVNCTEYVLGLCHVQNQSLSGTTGHKTRGTAQL